ncbi:MAG: hypothetical protein BGO70_18435 [Bacteroidetes bacterium 43-93]|jgi:cytochrome c peroxidase|nr:cytochrome-c peroxidase [Bacteroidota bacterium]OJX01708.1 MAG: hypothetical protein BGO70_18435 [Bacteroidetes bacterium 43-93]
MPKKIIVVSLLFIALTGFKAERSLHLYRFPDLRYFPSMPCAADNQVTVEGAQLGRYLFYDPILSKDNNLSCGSCHKQANAFSDAPLSFSKGGNGVLQTRNTPPLFNLAWYPALFWDGKAKSVEEQVFHPVRSSTEMQMDWKAVAERINKSAFYKARFDIVFPGKPIDSVLIAKAIAQFERTLISCRSKYDSVLNGLVFFTRDEVDGFEIVNDMTRGDCLHCHTTDGDALGTTLGFSNNGLDSARTFTGYTDRGRGQVTGVVQDNGKFKIPSLRNLRYTAPYMHDGRFMTLEQVVDFYSEDVREGITTDSKMEFAHAGGSHLSAADKRKVIAFLNTLNDDAFVTDTSFSNPFVVNK